MNCKQNDRSPAFFFEQQLANAHKSSQKVVKTNKTSKRMQSHTNACKTCQYEDENKNKNENENEDDDEDEYKYDSASAEQSSKLDGDDRI